MRKLVEQDRALRDEAARLQERIAAGIMVRAGG